MVCYKMANCHLRMKQKVLESALESLDTLESAGFPRDAWILEQYPTPPSIAAEFLTKLQMEESAIEGKTILDMGCGSGILAIGCVLLGAKRVFAIDIDENSVTLTRKNAADVGIGEELISQKMDAILVEPSSFPEAIDAVIMNPPFGTKYKEGIDKLFVEKSLHVARTVYSFHKTSTRKYWLDTFDKEVIPLFQVRFPIERLFKFHKKNHLDVDVDVMKFFKILQ